jgi:hypothetical protein
MHSVVRVTFNFLDVMTVAVVMSLRAKPQWHSIIQRIRTPPRMTTESLRLLPI